MANNKKNRDNLKPFPKGVSGNPNGRPKKIPELDKLLADVLGEEKDGIEAAKAILMALRAKATKGDVRAAEVLLDRAYGKAKQSTEITGKDGERLIPEYPTTLTFEQLYELQYGKKYKG